MDSNQRVVEFALDTNWNDLPESVRHQSKRALLDNLGVLIAGGTTPAARIMQEFVEDQMAAAGPQALCTVISTGNLSENGTTSAMLASKLAAAAAVPTRSTTVRHKRAQYTQ